MTRPYASHVQFRFYSGQSINADCSGFLHEMSMVGLMSHIAVVERVALNRRSISLKISFTRDKSLPVPYDTESIPDRFELSLKCMNPIISGSIHRMQCRPEIDCLTIDGSIESLFLVHHDGFPSGSIDIKYSSMSIIAHTPETVISVAERIESQ